MKHNKSSTTSYTFKVKNLKQETTLGEYLARQLSNISTSRLQSMIAHCAVSVNESIEKNYSKEINSGDLITISYIIQDQSLKKYDLKLDIIFEDENLMVINKPSNLTMHPGHNTNDKTLANALIFYSKNLSSIGGNHRPGIIHRLDKDTSGLILVAKNNKTHLYLSDQIMKRKVQRKYLALVYGVPNPVISKIVTNIAVSKKDRTKSQVVNNIGKIAITNYRVIHTYENKMFSLVECELETGRTHQIRVHMRFKNTPIIGDKKYSSYYNLNYKSLSTQVVTNVKQLSRQALHAYKISFFYPKLLKTLNFSVPVPSCIEKILTLLKIDK